MMSSFMIQVVLPRGMVGNAGAMEGSPAVSNTNSVPATSSSKRLEEESWRPAVNVSTYDIPLQASLLIELSNISNVQSKAANAKTIAV